MLHAPNLDLRRGVGFAVFAARPRPVFGDAVSLGQTSLGLLPPTTGLACSTQEACDFLGHFPPTLCRYLIIETKNNRQ